MSNAKVVSRKTKNIKDYKSKSASISASSYSSTRKGSKKTITGTPVKSASGADSAKKTTTESKKGKLIGKSLNNKAEIASQPIKNPIAEQPIEAIAAIEAEATEAVGVKAQLISDSQPNAGDIFANEAPFDEPKPTVRQGVVTVTKTSGKGPVRSKGAGSNMTMPRATRKKVGLGTYTLSAVDGSDASSKGAVKSVTKKRGGKTLPSKSVSAKSISTKSVSGGLSKSKSGGVKPVGVKAVRPGSSVAKGGVKTASSATPVMDISADALDLSAPVNEGLAPVNTTGKGVTKVKPTKDKPVKEASKAVTKVKPSKTKPVKEASKAVTKVKPSKTKPVKEASKTVTKVKPSKTKPVKEASKTVTKVKPSKDTAKSAKQDKIVPISKKRNHKEAPATENAASLVKENSFSNSILENAPTYRGLGILLFCIAIFIGAMVLYAGKEDYFTLNAIMLFATMLATVLASFAMVPVAVAIAAISSISLLMYKIYQLVVESINLFDLTLLWVVIPAMAVAGMYLFMYVTKKQDIDNAVLKNQVSELIMIDPLTGLYNLRSMFMDMQTQISFSVRNETPISLMIIKLRYPKEMKKILTTNQYEKVLTRLSEVVVDTVRLEDRVYSLTSDGKFAILLTCDKEGTKLVENRIREKVNGSDSVMSSIASKPLRVEVKIGYEQFDIDRYNRDANSFLEDVEGEADFDMTLLEAGEWA